MTKKQKEHTLLTQLIATAESFGVNIYFWNLKEMTLKEGHGYARFLHRDDKEKQMEFQGFFFDEKTTEIIQGNYPTFG